MLGVSHRLPAGRTGEDGGIVWRRSGRVLGPYGLDAEPFFDAGAAECVQAVKESKRLVQELSTDLEQGVRKHKND